VTVKEELLGYAREVDGFLEGCLRDQGIPDGLLQAMEYSLLAGGKRVRPVLCLSWVGLGGLPADRAMPFAAALELIHTYSLVHDDLPAMDNDDLRRGKPTNHKMFGDAHAILAGDGLLTEAFGLMCRAGVPAERLLPAVAHAARAAGAAGMVGGQVLDMDYTGRAGVTLEQLQHMHALKTGALIATSCVCGALLAGVGDDLVSRAGQYGRAVGKAFQIVDDILDVVGDEKTIGKPVGSDERAGKNTYPSLVGLDESRRLAGVEADLALASLEGFDAPQAHFLRRLARYIVDRVN